MDTGLKQRLLGAAVLVALAVWFLPMLVKGPAPDSGVSDVPLTMPDTPDGEMETRELPLVVPGEVPKGGAVGLDATPVDKPSVPTQSTETAPTAANGGSDPERSQAESNDTALLPATTAGGDYAVHFGAYASAKGAETVAAMAKAAQLPAYTEQTTIADKPAWRVRIGPYATRAEAESVRLKALDVRSDVPVRVVTLDAEPAPTSASPPTTEPAATEKPRPTEPAEASKPVQSKPIAAKPVETKPDTKPETQQLKSASKSAVAKAEQVKPESPKPVTAKPPAPQPPVVKSAADKVGFAVQLGAFGDSAEATAMRDRLRAAGFSAFTESVNTDKGRLTRVRVGPVIDRAAADQLKTQVKAKTGLEGIVRPHP
ncbi:MAG: SPOR domain-containing protein [Lysobacteraceae bacterium]|nr:MAG: SPOR domain-containing protein [Xanthomonadaceae bacterium]